ncbi:anthranilate synthase [Novimethylophilus kurashikiensis]|uniref:Anthranilate synthase n=1 Tax=Novimethylophilus kurashikiensis TaxID=1825523 RepID=A0A2R5F7X6_9PROT|nr:hypothetical protein [Novimethylophilus kurashikiensis]GBG14297.1 anthranilate synthase [Novimethylophilus kurashikiensis]
MELPFSFEPPRLTSYEMSPAVRERMTKLQDRLTASGCVNLHISWNRESLASGKYSVDEVVTSVCSNLEAILDGDVTPLVFDDRDFPVPAPDISSELRTLVNSVSI